MFRQYLYLILYSTSFLLIVSSCNPYESQEISEAMQQLPDEIDFNFHIKPLLSDRCFKCHGPDANQMKGELRLDIADGAYKKATMPNSIAKLVISPSRLKKSEFYHRIISEEEDYMMPPRNSHLSLNAYEKALLIRWIEEGAIYEPHWSFVPANKPAIPQSKFSNLSGYPIDQFIFERLEDAQLEPNIIAEKSTLLRRVALDLTGLVPSVGALDSFLNDNSPDAYEKAVDKLLQSPHFGEKLATEWLDVARYADSHGYQDDGLRNTFPWRDWVIKAFNENMPYNQFLTWQLAGDLLPNPSEDQLLATCFNRNHPQTQEGGVVDEEYRIEYVADRTNTLGKAFLGLTMECARCHDHKYDPISQKEYFQLFAFFNNNNETGIVPYNGEASPTLMLLSEEAKTKLKAIEAEKAPLEQELLSENYLSDFKVWYNKLKDQPQQLSNYGLMAHFSFDEAVEVPSNQLKLNPKDKPNSNKDLVISYFNKAKNKPDARIAGDKDKHPKLVEGKFGKAIEFVGDAGVQFNRDLDFDRQQPFSVSLWVKLLKVEEGPIFGKMNGEFEGYRGWLCKLNTDGTLSFQLNHVYPANCIDFQTIDSIPTQEWIHIAFTYDGSSKAAGVKFYINGLEPAHQLHTDNLQKSLLHGVKGSNWSDLPFFLGMDARRTMKNIVIDELKIYKRAVSELEVEQLYRNQNQILLVNQPENIVLQHYLRTGGNDQYNKKLAALTEWRKKENLLLTDQPEVMVMQELKTPRPTFILSRGAYDAPTEQVFPNTVGAIGTFPDSLPKNRLGLAQWLTQPQHPLTARVAVNRLWMICFGKGLVTTQEDFGNQGSLPSHPKLLDWLAVDFMEHNWDVKRLLKNIVLSHTYRQTATPSERAKLDDPENIWYSHYPAHRLSAELIRDNALAASGLLVRKIGGPSVYPYQPAGLWEALATRNATKYAQQSGDSLYRRSMYTIWKRSSPPPNMISFDAPDRYYCVVRRQKTATPLQSLILMNDPQFVEAARQLATRMLVSEANALEAQLTLGFKASLGRVPRPQELEVLESLYQQELADFKQHPQRAEALLTVGEYPINKTLNREALAAATIVASTMLNMEEFVMKR